MKEKREKENKNKSIDGNKTKSKKKAGLLYFLLPPQFRNEVKLFLNKNEKEHLEKSRLLFKKKTKQTKEFSAQEANEFYKTEIFPLVSNLITNYKQHSLYRKSFNIRFRNVPWYLATIHAVAVLYALFINDFFSASSFVVYAVLSTWVLLSQEPIYWFSQLQIFHKNIAYTFVQNFLALVFTLLAVILLIVTVGMLSVNETGQEHKSLALFLLAVFSAPLTEELLFRDLFYRAFHTATNIPLNAMALSSFLFALAHFQTNDAIVVFMVYWFAGMLLSSLRFFFGSLLFPLLAHSLANMALFLI